MSATLETFMRLDLVPVLSATLAAVSCALLGNFLVLRRQALMGDAISHAVLPGLVAAFLLSGSRSPWVMFVGAGAAGGATVALIELVKRLGRVEPGAAMGVVFSVMFALGVLLLERAQGARNIDLDPDCVLHGQLEYLAWWDAPGTLAGLFSLETLRTLPTQLSTLVIVALGVTTLVTMLFKELRIASFDPGLATTQGVHAGFVHALLMLAVAAATVASFEAVGSILVIAMLITPAATAHLLTDRLATQIWLSAGIAVLSATGGYALAANASAVFGLGDALNAAGTITVVGALMFVVAAAASPSHGWIARVARRRSLSGRIALEDLLGLLFRAEEDKGRASAPTVAALAAALGGRSRAERSLGVARSRRLIEAVGEGVALTDLGRRAAAGLVRRHRLWEGYLVDRAGYRPDHVHETAERLEHVLEPEGERATRDPHGKAIPDA